MSKIEHAIEIVKSNPTASRSDLIAKFMSELGMSKAGATTYYYNATRGVDRPKTERKAKSALSVSKARKPVTKAERQVAVQQKTATAAQIMKAAELARKRKEQESAKIRAELEEFEVDIDNYTFPNGTLSSPKVVAEVDQDKLEEIQDKNLKTIKKVHKTFVQDVA